MCLISKPEFPRPDRQRRHWLNLNGSWDFRLFPQGSEAEESAFAAHRISYDRTINVPFSWVCPLSGVEEDVAGTGWYRRQVKYTVHDRLFLCFGAVDYKTDVYVNGMLAGSHQGGYTPFEMEVTALWIDGVNTIEVRAEDNRRDTQTTGKQKYGEIQGIWQTVWLEERPQAYIRDYRIVTHISGEVTITINSDAPDGETVSACFDDQIWQGEVKNGKTVLTLNLIEPRLWSPDSPHLYEGCLTLGEDEVFTYFGLREITAGHVDERGYQWILLNGKPIYLQGALDQSFNTKGYFTYPSEQDIYEEVWRLKRLGLNMVRIHIKPEEPRKLYWMDKVGILVMEDMPCFRCEPIPEVRASYESEAQEVMARDINHPSIFSWVMFNETWGLFSGKGEQRVYLPETQAWVQRMYHWAKENDPTRLVEDNSACNYDHTETDLNTWHFYINGYPQVRDHIREVVENTYPGSTFNFIGGNCQNTAPLMNSECGLVWGVDDSAGDSDLAWQYHYMLNEYRLHEQICGFIFTEFHDVVNEFNGYYRIDNTDKDFGYSYFCRGMSLRDMHTDDFIAMDCPPMQTAKPGEQMHVPLVLSSFSDAHHGEKCTLEWELWHDGLNGRVSDGKGTIILPAFGYGATPLGNLTVTMPDKNAVAVLSLYMMAADRQIITRNFTTFDVQAPLPEGMVEVSVCAGKTEGFAPVWHALNDDKLCMGGSGQVQYEIQLPENASSAREIVIHMEAGSKRILKKDCKEAGIPQADPGFMHGYLVDRGTFENSYWMTDESRFSTTVEVLINNECIHTLQLENDWADARGMLSWHYQQNHRKLDEAGSYGKQKHVVIPSRLLPAIAKEGHFTLTFRVQGSGGLALYGRKCGQYPHGLLLEIK